MKGLFKDRYQFLQGSDGDHRIDAKVPASFIPE
jgi:hypothetical protein